MFLSIDYNRIILKGSMSMSLKDAIVLGEEKISVIGLGYVGLPLAVAFANFTQVVGFDISCEKIEQYKKGHDLTQEVGNEVLSQSSIDFTCDEEKLSTCLFHIIAVPTPIKNDKTPNLTPVIEASKTLGRHLQKGSIVVYESTVYPGVTEEICIPLLEEYSGLTCGTDFSIGYSPERINPGDKIHRLENITKVVSGYDEETLDVIADLYELIIEAGVHRASSIKVAEAAKVIENSQRDINIAFMNELAIIFNKMDIDTKEVLEAAGTKWNFLHFTPGLVGGHCIGVDPYYLTYRAKQLGYQAEVILSGRRINDYMGKYVAQETIKHLIQAGKSIKDAKVAILGITFKENCPDVRNTKVLDIINELNDYGVETFIHDPVADTSELLRENNITLLSLDAVNDMDAIIIAVAHDVFKELDLEWINNASSKDQKPILIDVKGLFSVSSNEDLDLLYWRL